MISFNISLKMLNLHTLGHPFPLVVTFDQIRNELMYVKNIIKLHRN